MKKTGYVATAFEPYTPNSLKREALVELNRIVGNKGYMKKKFSEEPWRSLGKEAWTLDAVLSAIDRSHQELNKDMMKMHKDTMYFMMKLMSIIEDQFTMIRRLEEKIG